MSPFEKLDVQGIFQATQLRAQRRLAQVIRRSSPAEMPVVGDRDNWRSS
jgi:hypothetical protein